MEHIELRKQRAKIVNDMAEIAASDKPEDIERYNKMDADQKQMMDRIDRIERSISLKKETTTTGNPPAPSVDGQPEGEAEERARAHSKAFKSYLLNGLSKEGVMDDEDRRLIRSRYMAKTEQRDMAEAGLGTGVATGAGVLVPVGFMHDIEVALKFYGPMLSGDGSGRDGLPRIMPTATGQSLPYPTENDTTVVGEQIGEGQSVTMNDISLGQIIFGAWKYSSKMIRVSIELLQDSAFDLPAYLSDAFAIRLGRILNTHMTTGAGTTQPQGIVTGATLGGTAVGASSNDGNSSEPNTIGSDDLVTLEHSVDPLYRNGARWMFHDSTLAAIKKVKDKYGRPLWMTSIREGEPDTINGYRWMINNDMDQLQTQASSPTVDKKTVLFGQFGKYMIRRVKEMSVLRLDERFAELGQVAFVAFARYDGQLLDAGTHPVKYLKNTY